MFLPFGSIPRTTSRRVPPLRPRWRTLLLVPVLGLVAGCDRDPVRTYRVPKEETPSTAAIPNPHGGGAGGMMMGGGGAAPNSDRQVAWTLPDGWQELEPNQFRVGNFRIPGEDGAGAEVTIIPLPGMAGTDFANVNRWRGQVGLPAVSEDEFSKLGKEVAIGDEKGLMFDLGGGQPSDGKPLRMLAAILRRGGTAWFIKAMGPDELVAGQREVFGKFLAGLKFDGPAPTAQTAAAAPATAGAGTAPATAWTVPEGWVTQPAGSMQMAKFAIAGDDSKSAEVSVATLAGDGGGLLANVNRWRRQLGMDPVDADGLTKCVTPIADGPAGAQLVLLQTGDGARAMTAAVVTAGAQTWFIKLMGDAPVVSRELDHLLAFVKGIDYGR
ncbi:MAG: hypothetical protein H7A46_18390 [Verrucomicrobiales bacterium]|nr:hypothetical protein [Verrucomicrobiales bacterium]